MAREIKFRVWFPRDKHMMSNEDLLLSDMPIETLLVDFGSESPKTVMQYTGLTDKDGKEIYEGDILTCKLELPAVVEYIEKEASFKIVYKEDRRFDLVPDIDVMKVIGNIYENPELLGGN